MAEGIQVGSAYLALGADASGLQRDLQKGESAVRGWASKLSGIFMTAGAGLSAGVTAPLLMLGNKAIDQASDMAESLSKVRVTFGDSAKGVEEFANSAAKNLGIAKSQALDAAGTFGNMFSAMGMGGQAAADMSLSVLQLGSDLGSFHNVDPTEMLQKLRSGLVGEAEPLRAMGILLTEATVKAKAMAMGLGDAKGNLTESEKVQARYALIVEQSKNAMGDFARTSDGLANATRIQNATFQDLLGTIGTQLLPIKLQLAAAVQKVLTWFQQLSPETQRLAVIFGAVAAAAGPVLIMMGMVAGAVATLGAPLLLIIGALGLFAAAWATNFGGIRETVMGAIQPVIDAIQTAIGVFQALSGAGQTTSQSLIGAFTAFLGSLIGFEQASALVQKFREGWEQLAAFFEPTIERLKAGFAGMMEGLEPIGGKLDGLVGAFEGLWTAVEPIVQMLAEVIGGVLVAAFNLLLEVAAAVMPDIGNIISAAIDIAVTVLNTLATVVTEVVGIVTSIIEGDWSGAWTHAQTIIETLATAIETIFGKILTIITTILGDVLKGVMNWLTNLDSEWKNKLEGLLGTVRAKFYSILGTIIMTMGNIKAAILGFDLKAAGAALIQGMIDGVTSKAAALVAEATGVVSSAVQAAKNLLGIHSPSTVFAEIGRQIIDGLSLGLSESEQVAIDALSKVFENLTNIASALALLSGFRAAPGLLDNLNSMIGQIKEIVAALQDLAGWLGTPGNPSVVSAKAGTDPLVEIANNIKAMVEGLAALGEFKPVGDVAAKVTDLVNGYKEVIAQFYDLALYLADSAKGLGDAVGALGVMAVVADSFGVIFQAWSAVAKAGSLTGPKNMKAMLASISDMLTQVVATLGGLKLDVTDELLDFAGRLADLAGAFGDIAKAWETVSKFDWGKETVASVAMKEVVGFLKDFAGQVMTALNDVSKTAPAVGEDWQTFLANVKGAIGLIADTAKAWETVSDFQPNAKLNVETVTNWLASLAGLATKAIEKVQGWGGIAPNETFNAFTTSVKGAIGLIADTAKAWETLGEFEWNSGLQMDGDKGVIAWLASLAGLATRAIEKVQAWGGITPNETFNAFVTAVKNSIGLIADTAKAWDSLRDFKPNNKKLDMNAVVDWLASLAGLALRALEGVQKWGGITPDEAFNAFTTAIKNSLGALSDALKFTEALALWKSSGNVKAKIEVLTADLKIIIDQVVVSQTNMRALVTDSLLKFVADISTLASSMATVVDLLRSIDELENTGNIPLAVVRIGTVIRSILTELATIIYSINDEKAALILNFGSAVGGLMQGLKSALDLAMAIPSSWAAPNPAMWREFTNWVMSVFDTFYLWVTNWHIAPGSAIPVKYTADNMTLVGNFAAALNNLMGGLKAALDLALAVPKTWAMPDASKWRDFTNWVMSVFDTFYLWVTNWHTAPGSAVAVKYTAENMTLVGNFAAALNSLMSGLKTALDLALAVPKTWSTPDPTKWNDFTNWVMAVFDAFYVWVQSKYGTTGGTERLALIGTFGSALSSLMGGLKTALELALAVPKTWVAPDINKWTDFITWVQGVFTSFQTYVDANYKGETGPARLALVGTFATAMQALMGGLKTALDLALALPTKWAPIPTGPDSPYAYLKTFVEKVFTDFQTYVTVNFPADSEAAKNLPVVATFAGALNNVMSALGAALEVFKGLQGYIPLLDTRIENFISSVKFAYGLIQTYATGVGVQDGAAATGAFATALNTVFQALKTALDLFKALTEPANGLTATTENFKNSLQSLISRISIVLTAWKTYVETESANVWGPQSQAFKTKLDAVFATLKSALDLFKDLGTAGMPSTTQISAFVAAVVSLFNEFTTQIGLVPGKIGAVAPGTNTALASMATGVAAKTADFTAAGSGLGGALAAGVQSGATDAAALAKVDNALKVGTAGSLTKYMLDTYKAAFSDSVGVAFGVKIADGIKYGVVSTPAVSTLDAALRSGIGGANLPDFLKNSYQAGFYSTPGVMFGQKISEGLAAGIQNATATTVVAQGVTAITNTIKQGIKTAFNIASPSKVTTGYGEQIAAGLGLGILGGLPGVEAATAALYRAAQPAFGNMGGEWDVNNRKVITVRFEGQAGGGVPLSATQFDSLKRELSYAIAIGA